MAPLESLGLSRTAPTQVSQPVPGQEKSDDQNSPAARVDTKSSTFKGMTTSRYSPHLHLLTSGVRPTAATFEILHRECASPKPEREASLASTPGSHDLAQSDSIKNHDSYKSLEFGTCTDPEMFPLMVKLASESVDTVEERQGLLPEEAQHQAFQLPAGDTSTFQKTS